MVWATRRAVAFRAVMTTSRRCPARRSARPSAVPSRPAPMMDIRNRLALLRLELPVRDFFLDRLEAAVMFVEDIRRGLLDFSTRQRAQQLRGFSARVVYNGDAGYKKEAA
jgi:hypothetical protein